MDYCGVAVGRDFHHVCTLREVRADEPPIRLEAAFYEPGNSAQVAASLRALDEAVVAVSAPGTRPAPGSTRQADLELERRGVGPARFEESAPSLYAGLVELGLYVPPDEGEQVGLVDESAYRSTALFETNVEGVFCALQGRRLPARRHPLGVLRRVQELLDDHVLDPGGDLWHRRIEEIEAAAAALCAHRYAVGHACWLGSPTEGAVVLPGSRLPDRFPSEGVLPPVERLPLA